MRLALVTILNIRMDNCLVLIGLLCSSFVAINRGTNRRFPFDPLGDQRFEGVRTGNLLTTRTLGFWRFREWIGGSRAYCILKWSILREHAHKYNHYNCSSFSGWDRKMIYSMFFMIFIPLPCQFWSENQCWFLKIMPKHGGDAFSKSSAQNNIKEITSWPTKTRIYWDPTPTHHSHQRFWDFFFLLSRMWCSLARWCHVCTIVGIDPHTVSLWHDPSGCGTFLVNSIRTCLLIWVVQAMGGCFILEQPRSSMVVWHPRVRELMKSLPKADFCDNHANIEPSFMGRVVGKS